MKRLTSLLAVAMLSGIAAPVFAESAPVYDADSMQSSDGYEAAQPDVMPPAPGQEGGTFVPADAPVRPSSSSSGGGNMDTRLKRLEQQMSNVQNGDSAARLESLQTQLQTLRGQVEQLTHQLQQVQEQQKAMYTDIDRRLSQSRDDMGVTDKLQQRKPAAKSGKDKLADKADKSDDGKKLEDTAEVAASSASAAAASVGAMKPSASADDSATDAANQPDVAEEQKIYQTAYTLIKAKKYNEAVDVLQGMLKKYPSGQFASNAHYWLGELYGLMGKNDQALSEFDVVVKKYPDSPRVSDAQLKLGLILAAESKWTDAKTALKSVINHYPGTASSRLASEQLKQIKQAGH